MQKQIPEIEAREILSEYQGSNNQLLEWKDKFITQKSFSLTRPQSEYVLKYHNVKPKVAKKYVNIVNSFGEKLAEDKMLSKIPDKIWCEKLLCESDKAYNFWGKINDNEKLNSFWIPKSAILQEEKKLNRVIDYSKYTERPPLEHQKVAIEKLLANNKFILADDMGLGKMELSTNRVFTPYGRKKIGDLVIGDKVIGSDGNSYNVTGVFPQGRKETYKVTFSDEFSVIVGGEHLWHVMSPNMYKNINDYFVFSTEQMLSTEKLRMVGKNGKFYNLDPHFKYKDGKNKWAIPYVKPINFELDDILDVDPYEFGFKISQGDYQYLENKTEIKIPNKFKYSTVENRISLLQGLLDGGAECEFSERYKFKQIEFKTKYENLCDDLIELIQTLGGIARKLIISDGFRVTMKIPKTIKPFTNEKKLDEYVEPKITPIRRYIKSIEKHTEEECVCISVDSPDKLYVTEHCIITHNTTSATIASIESGAKKILIVCPASLKINWKREIMNYTDRPIHIVEGRKWASDHDYYIINYDILKNFHSTDNENENDDYKLLINEKFDLAIVDEAHYISNSESNRSKLLTDVLSKISKVWLLTGTPLTSRPINYYNLLKIIESPLSYNWQYYVKRYCAGYQFRVGNRKIWNINGASNLDELREKTKNNILRRLKTDILDLPEKIVTPIFLELNSKMYDEELEDFMKITNDKKENETITVTLNRLMRIRQLIAYEKIPYTCELIDKFIEQGKKVVVLTNFTLSLDTIHEKYKKNSVILNGSMSKEKKQESVDKFQNDDKIKVFIGNIKAAGVGITLTAGEVVIMNDLSFVPADHAQGEDRCLFKNQDILTDKGYKKISQIKVGDYLYTHNGNFKRVTDVMRKLNRGKNKVELKIIGSKKLISVTDDHKIYIYDKTDKEFKWIESGKINIDNHFLTFKTNKINNKINENLNVVFKSGLEKNFVITNELLYSLGYFLSNGWIDGEKKSINIDLNLGKIKSYNSERNLITLFKKLFEIKNTFETKVSNNIIRNSFVSEDLYYLFYDWFGEKDYELKIPSWILELHIEQIKWFLKGFEQNGFIQDKKKSIIKSRSSLLISQFLMLYSSLGEGVIYKRLSDVNYVLEIENYKNFRNKYYRHHKGYILYPIESFSIKKTNNKKEHLFDFTVEDDHSFVVNNINVHNCYRYGQKNNVLIYYPVFENTIEKIVYNILQKKKNIIDQVMGDGDFSESFSKELIQQIL